MTRYASKKELRKHPGCPARGVTPDLASYERETYLIKMEWRRIWRVVHASKGPKHLLDEAEQMFEPYTDDPAMLSSVEAEMYLKALRKMPVAPEEITMSYDEAMKLVDRL